MTAAIPAVLVLGVGNPSRGDDALGPLFLEGLRAALATPIRAGEIELLTDYQLQIEHALDLVGRRKVVFVDASIVARAPFSFERVVPRRDESAMTHALSPSAVLQTYLDVVGAPPEAWVLAIRGERFELGDGLSEGARTNLEAALAFFLDEGFGTSRARAPPGA